MQPHQERVVNEKAELDEKLDKLEAFFITPLFIGIDFEERYRLQRQAEVMTEYSIILGERISAFK